ncbi:hypothetical protein (plasmid) [Enterobacter hormaechei subsp. steigerwaltii]|nr:Hypothetical protein [Enterobacter cloacae]AVX34829.1 hypothetical protein [Klebsiella pneumoniae]EPY93914.1 hypothetical protein L799_24185 [Enterobacter roggenkampii EC_38VIM1]ESB97166.1 hypothetical protein SEES004_04648 [Salmonella enterica subsp. enterica serovar Senftenberg str. 361154004]QBQ69498.1 Hypothetical protein [Leclercia adecarboxylata]UOL52390.1 hypothetical protein [Enterobacter hormaechei subsp. steigerwaltii]UUC08403.1 hypothetical protein [Citrobacter freundii]UUW4145
MRDIQKMMDRLNKPAFLGMIDDVEHAIKRKCPFLTYRLGTMSKIQSNRQSDG